MTASSPDWPSRFCSRMLSAKSQGWPPRKMVSAVAMTRRRRRGILVDDGGCKRWTSSRLGNQVIIRMADNLDLGEFSDRQFPADINASVNVRRVSFAACYKINAFH